MNALFRAGAMVVRVGRATAPAAAAHQLVATLNQAGIATAEPIDGWTADVDGFAATGWRYVAGATSGVDASAADWERVGAMVRVVHELPAGVFPDAFPRPSPTSFPWWNFAAMLEATQDQIDTAAWCGLLAAVEACDGWERPVQADTVTCHGDVHAGNIMITHGRVMLIDWDLLCTANPAWDHAALLGYAGRWGGPTWWYPAFASGYGRSFADNGLCRRLARLRDVAATLLKVQAAATSESAALEAECRLRYWRGERDAPTWHAQ